MKTPLKIDEKNEVTYELFSLPCGSEHVIMIDGNCYHVRRTHDANVFYFMVRVGAHQRSLRGSFHDVILAIARIHLIYREYEKRVRKLKEEAQRIRDRQLNRIVEASG